MALSIPLRSDLPFFELQVELESVTYTLEFRWNERAAAWFMNILDEDGVEMIRAGIRLVVNFPLAFHRANRQPPGILFAHDTSGQGLDPGLSDLDERVILVYLDAAEAQAIGG